jgi:hypothetical protein
MAYGYDKRRLYSSLGYLSQHFEDQHTRKAVNQPHDPCPAQGAQSKRRIDFRSWYTAKARRPRAMTATAS